jgi:hypothetical protein
MMALHITLLALALFLGLAVHRARYTGPVDRGPL